MQCAKCKDAALKSNELNVKRELASKVAICNAHQTILDSVNIDELCDDVMISETRRKLRDIRTYKIVH